VLDSTGKLPEGALTGNFFTLGDYKTCLDIDVPDFDWEGFPANGFRCNSNTFSELYNYSLPQIELSGDVTWEQGLLLSWEIKKLDQIQIHQGLPSLESLINLDYNGFIHSFIQNGQKELREGSIPEVKKPSCWNNNKQNINQI